MDPTEAIRRDLVEEINQQAERAEMEKSYGQVWDTQELARDFVVHGFMAPFVVVTRKSDNCKGSMMFQHSPRYYFSFQKD